MAAYSVRLQLHCLPEQFDAVLHIDETRAVEPLERGSLWVPDEAPHTFPSGV